MSPETGMLWSLAAPIIGALLIVLTGRHPNLRECVTLATSILLFIVVFSILDDVAAGERPVVTLLELMPGLGVSFTAEPLGALFAAVASGLWILTSIYSIGYMRNHGEQNQTRFYFCFAVALTCTMCIAFAGNMLTLFVFYEGLTPVSYTHLTLPTNREV